MAFQVLLAGQDITLQTDQMSLDIVDALGQSSGAGNSSLQQGRAGTVQFNAQLGPVATAYGAGQVLPGGGPYLVRQGELIFKDAVGRTIWGGYATKYTDITTDALGNTKTNFVQINGVDYEGQLNRVMVNETYADQTDVQIIKAVIQKYSPWISLSLLPTTGHFLFPVKQFRNVSVLAVLQTIAGISGYLVWIDFAKVLHYVSPASAQTSPFSLSDTPDFLLSYPHAFATGAQAFVVDDNSAINRVTFYGGNKLSNSINQDVSPLANGNNTIFPLAFSPQPNSDGLYHATVNGSQQNVGFANSTGPTNTCVSAGGTANALLDSGNRAVTFCTAPPSGATVILTYRYEFPLTVVVKDDNSHKFFGDPYLDGYISDSSVFDTTTAIQRCKVLLTQQSFGLVTLMVDTWQPGLIAGQLLKIKNTVRGINGTYLIQEVETEPLGAGNFVYHLTLGAWNWNLIDVIVKLAAGAAITDDSQTNNTEVLDVEQVAANVSAAAAWVLGPSRLSPYYARSTAVGDGHDAYPGFATISS